MNEELKEFEGKTLDDAIQNACKNFNCEKKDIDYEVITRGSTGIFGLGGKKARIKAKCKKTPEKTEETPKVLPKAKDDMPKNSVSEPVVQQSGENDVQYDVQIDSETLNDDAETEVDSQSISEPRRTIEKRQAIEAAREIAEKILSISAINCSVAEVADPSELKLIITGNDSSLAIGRDGQNLDAIEYITGRLLAKKFEPDMVPAVFIDVNDYRVKKEEKLSEIAVKKAELAKKIGKAIYLNPMTPKERRVVHMALKGFPGIRTASIGIGDKRKVMLVPANAERNPGPRNQGYKSKNPSWQSETGAANGNKRENSD